MQTQVRETDREKRQRLANWRNEKFDTHLSFGVRLASKKLDEETEECVARSLEEYLEEQGTEEADFSKAVRESEEAHAEVFLREISSELKLKLR